MAQHDYVIANQSGAAFRADLNNALAAIVSQNSGAAEPSTTYAYQWWADTTTGLLKIRNAANNAWITVGTLADANLGLLSATGGTLTGALLLDDSGTAALPAAAFDNDADTGIYRKAANELGFAAGGVLISWLEANGFNIGAQGDLRLWDSDSSNYVALQSPATVGTNLTWTLPTADGTADQVLATNGSGVLSFATRTRQVRASAVASTSGTAIDFTSIPSWVKRITVLLAGVSTNGTSQPLIQLGDSGGIESSGYIGGSQGLSTAPASGATAAGVGFPLQSALAANSISGIFTLCNVTGDLWCISGSHYTNSANVGFVNGYKTLSDTLEAVRITTITSVDTFDAGTINILYEG
jgi:hypothetical protein